MAAVDLDKNLHEVSNQDRATQLTAGAVSTSAAGTISPTTAAGASPTVTITNCTDRRGNGLLNPVTGGGAQAAGTTMKVRFATPYTAAPAAVLVNVLNETDNNQPVACGPTLITADGFDVQTAVLTTAKAYRFTYVVIP